LNIALEDMQGDDRELKHIVDDIYSKYGQQLLNLCINHKVKRGQNQAITPVIDANWQLQFEYRTSGTDPSASVNRRKKFKPV